MTLPRTYLEYPRRRRGMDHDRYDYRNLFRHAPVKWPNGARVALIVVPVIEWFPLDMNPSKMLVKASGGMDRPYPDYWNYTTRDYGTRVGIYRIFKVLQDLGVPATVAMSARIAERHPFLLREVLRRDWEVVAHGLDMSHVFHGKSEEAEEGAAIGLAARTLRAAGAQRVRGWLSPMQSESHVTLDLLSENGFDYTLDWNVDDLPLAMNTRKAPIYGVPYALDINDRQSVHEFNLSNDEYVEQLLDSFRTLWEEAGQYGGRVMTISANGWLTGQANRIAAFRRAMTEICAHPGVWPTTCSGMLDAYRAQS